MTTLTLQDLRQDVNELVARNEIKELIIDLIDCYKYQIKTDPLGELIQSIEDLYNERRLKAMAYDMANIRASEISVKSVENLTRTYIVAFSKLQILFNSTKYQEHWNAYCDSLLVK